MSQLIELIKACLIGAIQGFTEILPISSSAHNAIIASLLNEQDFGLANEIFLHFASTIAIIFFLRKDIIQLIINLFTKKTRKHTFIYVTNLIIASIPALVVWLLFGKFITTIYTNFLMIGAFLLITSLMLFLTANNLNSVVKKEKPLSFRSSFGIGLFQSLAIVPGISRSGATLFSGTCFKINQQTTIKFSLFLYLIASSGSLILESSTFKTFDLNLTNIISFVICFITTFISTKFLYNRFKSKHYLIFSIYTFLLGILTFFIAFI